MLILTSFCLLILSVSTSSNPRLYEIEKLLQRFDSSLDVNYLFYDIYRSQKQNPLLCKAEHGPYCSMINHKSITTGVLDTHENPEIEIRKKAIIAEYDHLRTKSIFGLSNTERDKLLQPLISSAEQSKEVEVLLTFEEAILNTEDSEITDPLVWTKEKGFRAEISPKPAVQTSKNDVRVTFQGIYVPAAMKVADKKTMNEKTRMDKENEGKDLKEHRPVSVYAYSKTTEPGEMRFSKAIKVKQIWARKHNMDVHEEEMKAQGKHKYVFEYDIKGQKDGKDVTGYKKDWTDMSTSWTRLVPEIEGLVVDRLLIPKNTDLDNLLLEFDLEEEMKLMTVGEYQDMMGHINIKLRSFANLEDEGLRNKILGDEVKLFLRKRGFDEMFIRRLLDNLIIKKTAPDTFDVKLDDVESFVEKFVAYKNFVLVVNPGEGRKIKEQIKTALKDSTKKGADFQDLTEGQLKEMLERMDKVNFDEYDQPVLLNFMFEEKTAEEGSDGASSGSSSSSGSGEKKKGKSQDDL